MIVRKEEVLVFVEVKLRSSTSFGDPLEAVTPRKQATLRRLAHQYLSEREPDFDTVRFDVVGILAARDRPRVRHVVAEGLFYGIQIRRVGRQELEVCPSGFD